MRLQPRFDTNLSLVFIVVILICICHKKVKCTCCDQARERHYRILQQVQRERQQRREGAGATDTSIPDTVPSAHHTGDTIDKDGVIRLGQDLESGNALPADVGSIPPPYSPSTPKYENKDPEHDEASVLQYAPPSYPRPAYRDPSAHLHTDVEYHPLTTHQA